MNQNASEFLSYQLTAVLTCITIDFKEKKYNSKSKFQRHTAIKVNNSVVLEEVICCDVKTLIGHTTSRDIF